VQHNRTEKKERVPVWLNAILWSVYGVLGALLTICILTASLLWLVRWALPAVGPPGITPVMVTGELTVSVDGDGLATPEGLASSSSQISETGQGGTTGGTVTGGTDAALSPSASGESGSESPPSPTPALMGQDQSASSASQTPDSTPGLEADTTGSPSPDSTASMDEAPVTSTAKATATTTSTPLPSPTFTATPTPTPIPLSPQEYIVQRDDWLSKLSDKFYGDILAYPAIVKATNAKSEIDDSFTFIEDPDVIEVGQKLWIPTAEEAAALLTEEE